MTSTHPVPAQPVLAPASDVLPVTGDPEPSAPRAEISRTEPDTAIVTLVGATSRSSVALLSRALHAALDAGPGTLLVDLGRLDPEAPRVAGVLRCAGQRATSQHTHLQVLPGA